MDSKLIVGVVSPCDNAFPDEVRKLPGVAAAGCSLAQRAEHAQCEEHRPRPGRRRPQRELRHRAGGFRLLRDLHRPSHRRAAERRARYRPGQRHGQSSARSTRPRRTVIISARPPRAISDSPIPGPPVGRQMRWPVPASRPRRRRSPRPCPRPRSSAWSSDVPKDRTRHAADPTFYFRVADGLQRRDHPHDRPGHPGYDQGHRSHLGRAWKNGDQRLRGAIAHGSSG